MNNEYELTKVSIRLVKDAPLMSNKKIQTPLDAVEVIGNDLCEIDREVCAIVNLKADGQPINCHIASIGALNYTIMHPRELLKSSILSNASNIILLHTHPSGNLHPSKEDVMMTDRILQICNLIGIGLLDHIIIGGDNSSYFSFKEKELLKYPKIEYETDYTSVKGFKTMDMEQGLAYKVADRIIRIRKCDEGYDYSIMDENYREIDGGIYDNLDADIHYVLLDILDDLREHPDTNGAKGQITKGSKLISLDFEEVIINEEEANRIGAAVYRSREVMEFKARTEECFNAIDGMNATEIEEIVEEYVNVTLNKNGIDASILGVALSGSRCRGLEGKHSDLDVVVELQCNEREDVLFNLLHQDKFIIGDVLVDINPITGYKTGTLREYLPEVEKYLQKKKDSLEKGEKLYHAVKTNNYDIVQKLINDGADVNYVYKPEEYGYTPLHMAAYYKMLDVIELLIKNGANVNALCLEGQTPLSLALHRHNSIETISLLQEHGANDGTVPISDFALVGEVFLTNNLCYYLIDDKGIIRKFNKTELRNLVKQRNELSCIGHEVKIKFKDNEQSKTNVYYGFSFENIQKLRNKGRSIKR